MDLSVHLQKMITSLKKTWELTVKYDSSANLDQFLKMAMEIAEVDIQNTHEKEALDLADEAQTEEELDDIFENTEAVDCSAAALKRHQLFREFEQFARDLSKRKLLASGQQITQTTVSNEMEITETSHAIDPITKGPLIRPVRNRHCHHIYGYQSVMDSLLINPRLRCPMVGCSNKIYVVGADLIEI